MEETDGDRPNRRTPAKSKSVWSRLRSSACGLLVGAVALAVAIAALEVAFRISRPQQQFTCTVNAWDRVCGTRQVPGARGFVIVPEYSIDLIINSKGLRDREYSYAKPRGVRRILCLGDSFTCGYGVQADETYPKVLERLLGAGVGPGASWEVMNAGVGSTGTANQVAYYGTEGFKYQPDVVVVGLYQNDFHESYRSGLYSLDGGALTKHDAPTTIWRRVQSIVRFIPGYRGLFAKSHLLNFAKVRIARRHYERLDQMAGLVTANADTRDRQAALAKALFASLQDSCAEGGSRLVVMFIPRTDLGDWPQDYLDLMAFLEAQGSSVVDLLPVFRECAARGGCLTYPQDRHWTHTGHFVAGEALYQFLGAGRPPIASERPSQQL
ncbi:MAG: GDSL-type esterase/lipase family protein [bacterium]